ncbi:MAG: UvrD-helicase domain-containing protein [Lachnospirales bacterium]
MEKKLTLEQQQAIDIKNREVIVSAGAGAGKTSVLVDRVIKKIINEDEKVKIDEILIVTFTSDASKVMKDRIYTALNKELAKSPNNEWILRQIFTLNKANISTIHGFCQKVIEKNINLLNIDPKFRVAGTEEIELIKDEVFNEVIEKFYSEAEKNKNDFYALVNCLVTKVTDISFKNMFFDIYDKALNNPYPLEYIENSVSDYEFKDFNDFLNSSTFKIYKTSLFNILKEKEKLEEKYRSIFLGVDNVKIQEVYSYFKGDEYTNFYESYENLYEDNYIEFLNKFLYLGAFESIISRKAIPDEYLKAEYDAFMKKRKELKSKIDDYLEDIVFLKSQPNNILEIYEKMFTYMKEFKSFFISFHTSFKDRKALNKVIDYSDMEHFTIELLVEKEDNMLIPTKACEYYNKKYKEVIVDEYQDCNDIQELIFQSISLGGKNMYMVGDVKQSIYKFRGAKPNIFISKLKGDNGRLVINLNKNFRSKKNILDFANQVFNVVMKEKSSSINYDENHILELGKLSDEEGVVEVLVGEINSDLTFDIIEKGKNIFNDLPNCESFSQSLIKENEAFGFFNLKECYENILHILENDNISFQEAFVKNFKQNIDDTFEGDIISNKILELMETKGYNYSDFAILLRSKSSIKNITKSLESHNIPYLANEKENIFASYEVLSVTNYLKIIDNKFQDIPLVFVLKLPIYNFLEDELLTLKKYNHKYFFENIESYFFEKAGVSFYDDIDKEYNIKDELFRKVSLFLKDYIYFKNLYKKLSISDFILNYINKTNLNFYLQCFDKGAVKNGNLYILVDYAKDFENTSFSSVFNFVKFIEKQEKNVGSDVKGASLSTVSNKVNIMTIHGSKGLEFKVVFLGQINKQFNKMDMRKRYIVDKKFAFKYKDLEKKYVYEPLHFKGIKEDMTFELLAEEIRVLYVALTRAEEKLYITFCDKSYEKSVGKWEDLYESFLDEDFSKINSYSDLIMPIAIKKYSNNTFNYKILKQKDFILENKMEDISYSLEDYFFEYNGFKDEIPIEISVTKLLNLEERKFFLNKEEEDISQGLRKTLSFKKPDYLEKNYVIKGMEFGTLIHKIFWLIPFTKEHTLDDIECLFKGFKEKGIITNIEYDCLCENINIFVSFFEKETYQEILQASQVYKEKFFASLYNVNILYEEIIDESFLLKGVIDLMYVKNEKIYILDYKTDTDKEIHFEKYKRQLSRYKEVIEKVFDKEVEAMYIYFTSYSEVIKL